MSKSIWILLCILVLLLAGCDTTDQTSEPVSDTETSDTNSTSDTSSNEIVSETESSTEENSQTEESSGPPIVIEPPKESDAPINGEQMEGEFGKYTFVSEENGKRIAGLYSAEQISDFASRRQNGEWYTITYDEMHYLVEDTYKLFETYDLVRITDIHGDVHTFYGLSFYSSEEYFDCFNRLASSDDPACSFDLDQDMRDALFMRLEVLNTAVCYEFKSAMGGIPDGKPKIIYFGIEEAMTAEELSAMSTNVWIVYNDNFKRDVSSYPYGAVMFKYTDIFDVEDVSAGNINDRKNLDPGERFAYNAGKYEYGNTEKSIVVEIQETKNYYTVARIRIDDKTHLEEMSMHWSKLYENMGQKSEDDPFEQISDYRIILYFNGFPTFYGQMDSNAPVDRSIMYQADGKFNSFSLAHDSTLLDDKYHLGGSAELAKCINRIVEEIMQKE